MHIPETLEQSQAGLVARVANAISKHQLNPRTKQTYLHWIARFVLFNGLKSPDALEPADQQVFLSYLKDRMRVSRARLNQAQQALQFFYEDVLDKQEPALAPG